MQEQGQIRTFHRAIIAASLVWMFVLLGCAGPAARKTETSQTHSEKATQAKSVYSETTAPANRFKEPTELDTVLDAKPITMAAIKPASQASSSGSTSGKAFTPVAKGKGNFRIQVGAESDVDAAQAKKQEYDKVLGGSVDVVFDAPYYKLRWGYFTSKQDAEDKILELTDHKIQGFVVKQ